jgi:hypothetical protein
MAQILINPRGVFQREVNPIAPRPESLDNKVLGLVENSKDNADIFLDAVRQRIQKSWNIKEVIQISKSISGTPAPYTDAFFDKCDIVVNAFGD